MAFRTAPPLSAWHQTIGDEIRRQRAANGWTQAQAAASCGLSMPSYQKIESGLKDLRADTFCRIAAGLGLKGSTLLRRVESRKG
jgi:transcriptional regulator with XRE-family HTH domain